MRKIMLLVVVIVGFLSCEDHSESIEPQLVEVGVTEIDSVNFSTVDFDTLLFSDSIPIPLALEASAVSITEFVAHWEGAEEVLEYDLDVSSDSTFTDNVRTVLHIEGGSINDYKVTNLVAGTMYFYRVRSVLDSLRSENSNIVGTRTLPPVPVALAATAMTEVEFVANWEEIEGVTSYVLDVSENGQFTNETQTISDIDASSNQLKIDQLKPNTTYFYRVRAILDDLESENSNVIEVQTLPSAPVAIKASGIVSNEFVAKWETEEDIASYELDVSENIEFSSDIRSIKDIDGAASSYKITGLKEDTKYYYRLRSINGGLISKNSNTIEVLTLIADTEVPVIDNIQLASTPFTGGTETPITTYNGDIYLTYVDENLQIRVSKNGEVANFGFKVTNNPTHEAPSIAVDKNGYVHLVGGHHNKGWNYWVSKTPETLDFERVSGGLTEDWGITYCGFVKDRNGDLFAHYRYIRPNVPKAGSRSGNIAKYDANAKVWNRLGDPDKGVFWMPYGMKSDNISGGWYQPMKISLVFDSNNLMHIACSVNDGTRFSATEIFYATYDGTNFRDKNGSVASLPFDNSSGAFVVEGIPNPSGWYCPIVWDEVKGAGVIYEHRKDHYVAWQNEDWAVSQVSQTFGPPYHYSSFDGEVVYSIPGGWATETETFTGPSTNLNTPLDRDYFNETGNIRYFKITGSVGEVVTIKR